MQNTLIKSAKKILYVKHSTYDSNWHSIPHTHNFSEFFYVIQGGGQFFVETNYYDIKEDDLIIVNPHVLHTEISKPNHPLEYIVVGVEGLSFITKNDTQEDLGNAFSIHNYYDYKHEILFYLKTMALEFKEGKEYSNILLENLLEILIVNMIRRTGTALEVTTDKRGEKKECIFIENYIKQHFKEDITLDKLSEVSYTNKYYLAHAFKKYKGISPISFLVECRIKEAQMLLETTNLKTSDIAGIVGFSSQSYFSQAFRRVMNCTPQQYRKAFITHD